MQTALQRIEQELERQRIRRFLPTELEDTLNASGQIGLAAAAIDVRDFNLWPSDWTALYYRDITRQDRVDQLIVAGVLYKSEIARIERQISSGNYEGAALLRLHQYIVDYNSLLDAVIRRIDNKLVPKLMTA